MPISFILVGIFLISNLFGLLNFSKSNYLIFFSIVSMLVLFGYFKGDVFLANVSVNVCFLIFTLLLLAFFVLNKMISLYAILATCVMGFSYYFFLNKDYSLLLDYGSINAIKFLLVLFFLVFSKDARSISNAFFSSIVFVIISAIVSFDNFFVFNFDFLFSIEVFVLSSVMYCIRKMIYNCVMFGCRKGYYVKKDFFIGNSSCYVFVPICK